MNLLLSGALTIAFTTLASAQAPQTGVSPTTGTITNQAVPMNNQTVPMNNQTVPMNNRPVNATGAPTGNSTLGPAGRPNTELVPSTRGTINSVTGSTMSGDSTGINRFQQRTMNPTRDTSLPPNTTSPLPNTN